MDKVAVAKANIRLSYDREAGYFGSSVRGSEFVMTVTEYDRILTVTADGTYRIMAPPEKAWMPAVLLYAGIFDKAKGARFTLIYRDANGLAWGKKVHIERFITNKTYWIAKEGAQGIDFLTEKQPTGAVKLNMVPAKRQKVKSVNVDIARIPACGLSARGVKLTTKPIAGAEIVPPRK